MNWHVPLGMIRGGAFGWRKIIVGTEKPVKQARPMLSIRMFGLRLGELHPWWPRGSETYPFEIPVDYSLVVYIDQSARDVSQLQKPFDY